MAMWRNGYGFAAALGGKTIVGGLHGGWAGVELAKWRLGIRHSTGDVFVFPLIFGMSVGRIGCFLTGLPDHTYGNHTSLPWAVNFGDGPRHPTQLYDIVFLCLLGGGAVDSHAVAVPERANLSVVRVELLRVPAVRGVH